MANKKQGAVLQRLGDLLKTRIDVQAFLQELFFESGACAQVSRRTFGYTPAILGPAPTSSRTRARLLFFPAPEAKPQPPKTV
jgi:hypothetical protein